MQTGGPRTLLVIKPGSFGDILHTLPTVARLKAAWPRCRISWLANTEWMPLLAGNPDVDEVIEFPRSEFRRWGGGWKAAKWVQAVIRGRKPDLALDFQGLLRSALIGRASGARMLVGASDSREGAGWFYHSTVTAPVQPIHAVERYLALAEAVVSDGGSKEASQPKQQFSFKLPEGEPMKINLEAGERFILLHPYARGKNKSLDLREIQYLLRKIDHSKIVLVGRGQEVVSDHLGHCVNLMNQTTIHQLIWLMRRASFVASVDSGPAHLAAALGKPMVAIHSWSDPRKVGPYRSDAWVWKNGILTQMRRLPSMEPGFFAASPLRLLKTDLAAIARLAISPSDSSA